MAKEQQLIEELLPLTDPQREQVFRKLDDVLIKKRLGPAYALVETYVLTSNEGEKVSDLVDLGAFDVFPGKHLRNCSKKVHAIDINRQILQVAQMRPWLRDSLERGNYHLLQMDALHLGFPDNFADVVTAFESVIGLETNGGEQEKRTIQKIVQEAHRVLKPKGLFFVTIRSQTNQELNETSNWLDDKGIPIDEQWFEQTMIENGFEVMGWYGQVVIKWPPYGPMQIPKYHDDKGKAWWDFTLYPASDLEQYDKPLHWIGIFKSLKAV